MFTQDIPTDAAPGRELSRFLLDELTEDVAIRRVADPLVHDSFSSLGNRFGKILRNMLGDSSLGWGFNVFRSGLRDLNESDVDLIFGVTPPFTNALTALLMSWVGNKPLVLDLKDDWVNSPTFGRKNAVRQKIEKLLEYLVIRRASAVITVTPQSLRLYEERYAHLREPGKFHLVPNGCDLDEYAGLEACERKIASTRFLILSAAWGFRKDYRDISPFLLALDIFLERRPEARDDIEVVLLGDSISDEYDEMLSSLRLNSVIRSVGAVRRKELVDWLWKADLLLLVQPIQNTTAISGTLYEYWAAGKAPILLISEKGASSMLVDDNRLGGHFHFDQIERIAAYIEEVFDAYQRGSPIWIERKGIQEFDRRTLAKKMDSIWRNILLKE